MPDVVLSTPHADGSSTPPAHGTHAIFQRTPSGHNLLTLLTDDVAACELTRALTANQEFDEGFTSEPVTLDDLHAVNEICAATGIEVPLAVVDALVRERPWLTVGPAQLRDAARLVQPGGGPCRLERGALEDVLIFSQAGWIAPLPAPAGEEPAGGLAGNTRAIDISPSALLQAAAYLNLGSPPRIVLVGRSADTAANSPWASRPARSGS
jgi:hypothetical protein